jgi:integrase
MEVTKSQMLNYILEHGIIDIDTIQVGMEMDKRKELLKNHPYKIYKSTDGYWHTYIMQDGGKRKAIKKKTKEAVEEAIIGTVKVVKFDKYSFKTRYEKWIERQRLCGRCGNTITKYRSEYKRFFEGYHFEAYDVREITEEDIAEHFTLVLKEKQIPYKAFKEVMGQVNGVFRKCAVDRIIKKDENPCEYIDIQMFKRFCKTAERKTATERTLSNTERRILLEKIHNPIANNNNPVVDMAVELSLYTGMRVGELAGLCWSSVDFENSVIFIERSEKHDRETGEYYISTTKNDKVRIFPMTEEIRDVLERVKLYQDNNDIFSEFVFYGKSGKVHATAITNSARNKTMSDDFSGTKSIHAIRRTVNSRLRCAGVSATVASALMGHTERVNELNYTYDVSEMAEKLEVVKRAGAF